jgi:hypothetical protein
MHVIPQPDGALSIENPDKDTVYDMGNHRLFATFDGQGGCKRALLVEGRDLGRWELRLQVDGQMVTFSRARAIGRLWELHGEAVGVEVVVTSFLEEGTPIIFQECCVRNHVDQSHRVDVVLALDFAPAATLRQQVHSSIARQIPRLPGLQRLWSQGWAKPLLPASSRRVEVGAGGQIAATGKTRVFWASTRRPCHAAQRGRTVQLRCELELTAGKEAELAWVLGSGHGPMGAMALAGLGQARQEAESYARWLTAQLKTGDSLLRSMFVAGLNVAVSMFKEFPGEFSGLVAGAAYAYPPRLYFRDAYWTAQMLLPFRPELVRRHLLSLARGVHVDGQCPSGVFAPHIVQEWGVAGPGRLDWLPDHYDAPPFLVLLVADYVRATQDWAVLDEQVPLVHGPNGDGPAHCCTLWQIAQSAVQYLMSRDQDGDGLVGKPHEANDWADNVRRSTWVSYDQALYAAVLHAAAEIATRRGERQTASLYGQSATTATRALNAELWDADRGYYVNYCRPGFVENHFSIDTLVAVLYGLTEEQQTRSILAAARQLQTRHNSRQPYGDWGIMSVFPPYQAPNDLFGKSSEPYHYHNGADWPYWDGVYGLILRRMGDPDWYYVLTRWWEYSLAQGWLTPVEYYSPAYPPGGMLQGWSAMPAAALVR